jgi:DNA-binding transcriptional ArsR family regulator
MDQAATVAALGALAQARRLEAFRLLVAAGPQGLPAGAIAGRLGIAAPTLSFHLGQLKWSGLVTCRRRGRSLIYAADYAAMRRLLAYLTENCCGRPGACGVAEPRPAASADDAPPRRMRR